MDEGMSAAPISVTILAQDDDTVVLQAPGLRVHIDAGSWREANTLAHRISELLRLEDDVERMRERLEDMRRLASRLHSLALDVAAEAKEVERR